MLQDAGAYPTVGAFLPVLTHVVMSGVYAIPKIEFHGRGVVTNTTPVTTFRGAGRPEASQSLERMMDLFAAEIGMDPIEVRRRNFIPKDAFPYKTATGATYDSGDYEGALDLALRAVDYEALRAEQKRRREAGDPMELGIGISTYTEITNPVGEAEFGEVEITEDGGAIVRTGSFSHGQGHETTFAMIASERLGLPIEKIDVVKGDTDAVAQGTGTYGSKSTQIGGAAARGAAERRRQAGEGDRRGLPRGERRRHRARHRPRRASTSMGSAEPSLDWAELASRAAGDGKLEELKAQHEFGAPPTFPFGAHIAVVEVDTETGVVDLERLVAVDDAGHDHQPADRRGPGARRHRDRRRTGAVRGVRLRRGRQPDDEHVPRLRVPVGRGPALLGDIEMVTPTPTNPLGAKGIGESGTIGSTPAVLNAVVDALAPHGVTHVDLPCNGESVWRALQEAKA